ncbi:HNH endonuclease [Corynebacterium timonense]|uniref:HNH endonuclease n=3 Tax=Corynebacterium timonense TaxID=441500 RepID=A0A1H1V9I3_9CORY|nr:HNH endonuclease [Corynebacterium timonense]
MDTPPTTVSRDSAPLHIAHTIEKGFGVFSRRKAQILYAIALFDVLGLAPQFGAQTTALWLVRSIAVPNSTAHEYVRVARAMLRFEVMAQAFLEGRTNYSKVRLILPLLTKDNEAELVELACTMTFHELEIALLQFRQPAKKATRTSYVRLKAAPDGRIKLWADFNAAEGARVMAAMKVGELAWHDVDWASLAGNDGAVDPERIDGEMDRQDKQGKKARGCSGFGLPIGQVLVSAFMGMVNMTLSRPRNPLRAPGAHVNVVMTTDGKAYLPYNPGAPSEAVKNFLANASYRLNRVDDKGLVLNSGRAFRLASDAQVNALMLMWRHQCAMPGCSHTRFIEMHHVRDWADGGPTDLDNLLPLCSACHSLVSDKHITILRDGGDFHFLGPGGVRYVSTDRGLPVRNDDARTLEEFNELSWV